MTTPLTALIKNNETESNGADDAHSFHASNQVITSQKRRKYLSILVLISLAVGLTIYFVLQEAGSSITTQRNWPIVASTWPWTQPIEKAWSNIIETNNSLDAVQIGCETCEQDPASCDWSVGWGGSPDTNGEVRLDAMIMYGPTHNAGAVASLKNIKNAIGVARFVLHYTTHTLLVGQSATDFAVQMGFQSELLNGTTASGIYSAYLANNCQPHSWINVINASLCPPYAPIPFNYSENSKVRHSNNKEWSLGDHDTIGMIGIDSNGFMSIGTSTNGATLKIAGRVGDSPLVGAGGYVEQGIGAAVGTGDGDVMMRFAATHAAVFYMKQGMDVGDACRAAVDDIVVYNPGVYASLVCMDANGEHDGATSGLDFPYTVETATVVTVVDPYSK